jgi:pimeloyl-ACP methyl ester carboxylesterase
MDKWGYEWEAYKVRTEDQYILSTFHILGKKGQVREGPSKGSVLCQHGDFGDGTWWMEQFTGTPFQLLLVDQGYDVWLGNNRGTEDSLGHETLNATDDNDYWKFTWADMGLYDDTANVSLIKEKAGVDKVFYIGFS